ncbi:hypothetical protein [Oceanobacillus kapialis]|uniref:DUF304 domain-containing protein n=1 Tax=Oceanobacillus kapialis TaxID=481353 RepID=A0ABW5Q288_9BACI
MRFPFADISLWRKRSKAGIGSTLAGVIALLFQAYRGFPLHDTLDYTYLIVSFLPILIGVLQYINNVAMLRRDYIIMDEDEISIYRAFFLPRKKIPLENIERYIPVSTLIILRLKDGREHQFNTDWLSKESIREIRVFLSEVTEKKRHYG